MKSSDFILDFDRVRRTGLHEAVMCMGKSVSQLQQILGVLQEVGKPMLFTRLEPEVFEQLAVSTGHLNYEAVSGTAFFSMDEVLPVPAGNCRVAVVTGGSSDIRVAREASRTLQFYGEPVQEINDVGVAGLWRLQQYLEELQDKQVIICVAGMDAALPTVLGGLVPALLIAVPSSVGYGVAGKGQTALNALLCSCAQGLVVVNIDNGFGAACAAIRALNGKV